MRVYRVEHKTTGDGPYRYDCDASDYYTERLNQLSDKISTAHDCPIKHPTVTKEVGNDNFTANHYCGFETYNAYRSWFAGFFKDLHDHDFVLRIYEVNTEHILFGNRQLAFIKQEAKLIQTRDIWSR